MIRSNGTPTYHTAGQNLPVSPVARLAWCLGEFFGGSTKAGRLFDPRLTYIRINLNIVFVVALLAMLKQVVAKRTEFVRYQSCFDKVTRE